MDLSPYVDQLRRDLVRAAALGDDDTRRTAEALAGTVESSARLVLLRALSDLAGEITGALDDTTVDVRLDGQDLRVTVEHHDRPDADDTDADDTDDGRAGAASWGPGGMHRRGRGAHGRRPYPPARQATGTSADATDATDGSDATDPADPDDLKQAMRDAGSELSRTTVRLFNDLKSQAESAASDQGVSLNTYISRAISDSVKGIRQPKPPRRRGSGKGGGSVTGWIQG